MPGRLADRGRASAPSSASTCTAAGSGGWVVADDVTPPAGRRPPPAGQGDRVGPGARGGRAGRRGRRGGGPGAGPRCSSRRRRPAVAVRRACRRPESFERRRRAAAPSPTVDGRSRASAGGLRRASVGRVGARGCPPAQDLLAVVLAARPAGSGAGRHALDGRGRRAGPAAAPGRAVGGRSLPGEWAQAAAGVDVVIGARAAAWAPCPDLAAVVVLDGHDEGLAAGAGPDLERLGRRRRAGPASRRAVRRSPRPARASSCWPGPRVVAPEPQPSSGPAGPPLEVIDRRRDDPQHRAVLAPAGRPAPRRRPGRLRPQPQGSGPAAGLRRLRRAGPLRAVRRRRRPGLDRRPASARVPPVRHRRGRRSACTAAPSA